MNCFPCFPFHRTNKSHVSPCEQEQQPTESKVMDNMKGKAGSRKGEEVDNVNKANVGGQAFNFRELATATKNFRQECLIGEGGFGRVYKGILQTTGQVVAVKQLDRNGLQGNKEFLAEVLTLSLLHHKNLVNLVGYCADGDQRLLVYEYMSGGSLEDHLLDLSQEQKALDWYARMRIAFGAAQGLECLHEKANPPVIYRDLKPSNILLDEYMNPKLSDFGLAKLSHAGDKVHVSSRVMGTYGYCAPEYSRSGNLTLKSDVYSFGVVLLELITGRRAIDTMKHVDEQNLVSWAQPMFRDPKRFPDMADPLLQNQFPEKGLNQAVAIAAMCLQEEPDARPLMSDVVTALSFLSMPTDEGLSIPILSRSENSIKKIASQVRNKDHVKSEHGSIRRVTDSESSIKQHHSETSDTDSSIYIKNKRCPSKSSRGTSSKKSDGLVNRKSSKGWESESASISSSDRTGKRLSSKKLSSKSTRKSSSRSSMGSKEANEIFEQEMIMHDSLSDRSSGPSNTSLQRNSSRRSSGKESSRQSCKSSRKSNIHLDQRSSKVSSDDGSTSFGHLSDSDFESRNSIGSLAGITYHS